MLCEEATRDSPHFNFAPAVSPWSASAACKKSVRVRKESG